MASQVRETYLKRCVAVVRIQRCLHWPSSTIRSRVLADHYFKTQDRGFREPYRVNIAFFASQEPHDSVFVTVGPFSHYDYKYPIINNHPAGCFWYHSHWHGSVVFQVRYLIWYNEALLFIHCDDSDFHAWVDNRWVSSSQKHYFGTD